MAGIKKLVNHVETCDILVAGGGSAGCFAAIKAAEKGQKVILVDKSFIGRSGCSPFAAGAINICYPDDDKDLWFKEIVTRGEYLNDQEWVKIQIDEAYDRNMELHNWGKEYGLQVLAMKRIRIGRVSMGKLPSGQWKYLLPQERF